MRKAKERKHNKKRAREQVKAYCKKNRLTSRKTINRYIHEAIKEYVMETGIQYIIIDEVVYT